MSHRLSIDWSSESKFVLLPHFLSSPCALLIWLGVIVVVPLEGRLLVVLETLLVILQFFPSVEIRERLDGLRILGANSTVMPEWPPKAEACIAVKICCLNPPCSPMQILHFFLIMP